MFSSLKSGRGGDAHGLGLALLKRAAQGAGGEIFIRDSSDQERPSFCACRLQYDGLLQAPGLFSYILTARYSQSLLALPNLCEKGR